MFSYEFRNGDRKIALQAIDTTIVKNLGERYDSTWLAQEVLIPLMVKKGRESGAGCSMLSAPVDTSSAVGVFGGYSPVFKEKLQRTVDLVFAGGVAFYAWYGR